MTYLSPLPVQQRSPRARLSEPTPAVVRLQDGRLASGRLLVVSQTGGLLALAGCLEQHSQVKLMFVTSTGPVLGAAQMLGPVGPNLQPFQFASVSVADQKRLSAIVGTDPAPASREEQLIEKYRAAMEKNNQPKPRSLHWAWRAATFGTFGLATVAYLFRTYGLR